MRPNEDAERDEALGQAVKRRREALGFSQERLAHLANVSRSTIQNVEAGRVEKAYRLRDIVEALDTTVEALTGDDQRHPEAEPTPAENGGWNLLEHAKRLRDMADEMERQAEEQRRRRPPA